MLVHPAFDLLRSEKIASLNVDVQEFIHKKTQSMHYHLAADNPENVFLVALRTAPMDSTGVAHVLEHTVLCGSEKYPVRDPFFMMIRRSLNTFMNAFTSSDWTAYPFASQNKKDYFNLLDVYLDAVFFSRLHELDFAQEGHRLEYSETDKNQLEYKGVVYNEMKGAMSSPVSLLWQTLSRYLYPTTTYHYNSGGDPEEIPNLTYRQLKSFYKLHYHPSNAIFMTYGDIPVNEIHEKMEDNVLSRFEKLENKIVIANERRYFAPVNVEEYYPLEDSDDIENKTHVVFGWLLNQSVDLKERMRVELMSNILLDHSASPLRKALETSDLGTAPSPLCGMDDSSKEINFMCGLEGCKADQAKAVEDLIFSTLDKVVNEGVAQDQVDAALHQLEIAQREISGDGYPYGLQLILAGLTPAIHYGDPIALINLDPVLEELREEIKASDFLPKLVKEYLLDNPHRVRISLIPDTKFSDRRQSVVDKQLAEIHQGLSVAAQKQIKDLAVALNERQTQEDDEELLPKVTIEDIPESIVIPQGERLDSGSIPVEYYSQGTNGIVYQQLIITMPECQESILNLLPQFVSIFPEVGYGDKSYLQAQEWQSQVSAGINAFTSIRGHVDAFDKQKAYFTLSSKALSRNGEALTQLLKDALQQARFDETKRIQELISQKRSRKQMGVTSHGHSYAMMAAASSITPMGKMLHQQQGLLAINILQELDDGLRDQGAGSEFYESLVSLHKLLLSEDMQVLLVGEEEQKHNLLASVQNGWSDAKAKTKESSRFVLPKTEDCTRQLWVTSTEVNFCAKAYPTVTLSHPDSAALAVLGGFMRNGYLHRAIREQGGAYGGGASNDTGVGAFRFYSYRDPRLDETLSDFDKAIDWVLEGQHEWRQVEEAILGVIGSMDRPGSPAGEAKDAFYNLLHERTPAQRQAFRQRVRETTLADLQKVTEKYLQADKSSIAVITNKSGADTMEDKNFEAFSV